MGRPVGAHSSFAQPSLPLPLERFATHLGRSEGEPVPQGAGRERAEERTLWRVFKVEFVNLETGARRAPVAVSRAI